MVSQTELRSTLLKAGEQTKSEQKLLQNKQYRHLLDIHELLRVTGPDKVKAVFSKSAQDAAFIKTFLQDPAWMELYLGAGPDSGKFTGRPSNPLRHLESGRQEPGFPELPIPSTGLASVFSTGPMAGRLKTNSANSNPVRRYRIFKNCIRKTGCIRDSSNCAHGKCASSWEVPGTINPMNGAMNTSTSPGGGTRPPRWAAPYTGHNFFGDTIQGPLSTCRGGILTRPRKTRRSSAASAAASPTSAPWRPRPTASPLIR